MYNMEELLIYRCTWHTIYHESFEAEKFLSFHVFSHVHKAFMKIQDGTGFKRKYEEFRESLSWRSVCTTCHETFLPQIFMDFHGIRYVDLLKAVKVIKLCMDKLYVASILRIKVLSTFVMLQELERSMIQSNRQQQSSCIAC